MSQFSFTIDDLNTLVLDPQGHVWRVVGYAKLPTVTLAPIQGETWHTVSHVVNCLNVQGFKRIGNEVEALALQLANLSDGVREAVIAECNQKVIKRDLPELSRA